MSVIVAHGLNLLGHTDSSTTTKAWRRLQRQDYPSAMVLFWRPATLPLGEQFDFVRTALRS
jgi:hypothetical protein